MRKQRCTVEPPDATSERLTSPRSFPHPQTLPAMLAMTAAAPAAAASAARPALRTRRAAPVARGGAIVRASAVSPAEVSRRDALVGSAAAASIALFANPGAARAIDVGVTAPGFTLPATGGRALGTQPPVSGHFHACIKTRTELSEVCADSSWDEWLARLSRPA